MRVPVAEGPRQLHGLEQLVDPAARLARVRRPAVHDERLGDALGDRQQRVEARRRVLEDEPDAAADRAERALPHAVHLDAEHLQRPVGHRGQPGDGAADGRLAGAATRRPGRAPRRGGSTRSTPSTAVKPGLPEAGRGRRSRRSRRLDHRRPGRPSRALGAAARSVAVARPGRSPTRGTAASSRRVYGCCGCGEQGRGRPPARRSRPGTSPRPGRRGRRRRPCCA